MTLWAASSVFWAFGVSTVSAQTNTNRPVFVGSTNLSARVGQDFRYQILIGGTGRQWVGSDSFTNASISNVWTALTNTNGRLTNANGQLNLVASNATASNPALGVLQWVQALPRTNSWLAYMQVVVSNDLPITSAQYAAAGLNLFQSNRPSGSLVFTNTSEALLLRETSLPNRKASAFLQNNSPFTATFASNTANFYQRQAGPTNAPSTAASLVFSNLGTTNAPTNTLSYRSTTNSSLTNSNGLILGTPGPATAVASPAILLPSSTNWTVTVRVHYGSNNFIPTSYVGAAIVKNNSSGTPMQMFTNRVALALVEDIYGLYVASEAFASGTNIFEDDGAPWAWVEDEAWLRFSYDASSSLLTCAFFDPAVADWIDTEAPFDLSDTPGSLGDQWGFNAGTDFFRLLLTADTSSPGGNSNGADPIYFSDLVVTTEPADRSADSDGSSVWVSLLYDATTTNLVQQFSTPDGSFTDLTTENDTSVSLAPWGTNSSSPLLLRIGAEAGQTNLPAGAVAIRSFALIPPPGDMGYSSTNLPDGLTLDTDYGVVSGTPTTAGTNTFTVVASNPFGGLTATQSFRLSVAPTLPLLAVSSNGILRFGVTNTNAIVVTATNYPAFGTNPLTFTAAGLPAGLIFSNQAGGTSAVVRGAPLAGVGTNRVVFTASNSLAGAVTITSVVTIEPGLPALRLVQNRAVPRYSTSAVVSTTQPFWTLTNSASGQNGSIFTNLFTANSNFPSNALRLNPSNGQILAQTNRITNAGNFTGVVFTLSNAGGTAVLTSTITILPSTSIILTFATNPPFPSNGIAFGAISNNFFQLLVDTNAPGQGPGFTNTFALQSGPSGIRINPTNGIVFGTNNQAGNFTLRISARNLGGFSVTNILLGSKPPAPLFAVTTNRAQFGSNSTNALVMRLTNASLLNTNAFPVTWAASNLPPSFTNAVVGTNFVIRSTNPTEAGLFSNIVVIATNAGGATTNSNITLEVLPAVPALAVASNGTFQYEVENTNGIVVTVTNTNAGAQNTNLFPIAFSASNLPGGWTLSTNGGGLVGVIGSVNPTVATNVTNLLITVTNKGGSRSTNLTLRVLPDVPVISLVTNTNRLQFGNSASTNAVNVVVGSAGQNTNNFPVGFLASNLPTGVLFTTNATNRLIGVIGGANPQQVGIFTNVLLIITNAAGTNTETISLTVLPAAPQISVATNRAQFGSNSTNPVVVTVTNTNGQNLATFPLSFSSTNLPGGLAFTNTNNFVATAGAASPSVATNSAAFTVVVTNAGGSVTSSVTGFRILPAVPALLAATNGDFQFQTASATNAVTISVTNTNGQNTNTGQFPIGFVASNLPGGLGISTNGFTFNLTGTPTVVGIFTNITVRATNLAGTNTTNLTLNLLPSAPSIGRGTISRSQYQVLNSNVVTYSIQNTNAQNFADFPISYTVSNLPAGLTLTTNTNSASYRLIIGGTPTTAGNFSNILVTATNAGGSISEGLVLTILPSGPALSVLSNNSFQFGVSLSNGVVVAATNTNALFTNSFPVSFSLSGTVPPGIGLTSTNYTTNGVEAALGGTNPAQPGTFTNVVLTAINAGGTNTTNLTLTVVSAAPQFTVTNNRTQFGVNSPNALVITVTNSNAITTNSGLSFQVSNLPDGLALTNTNGFVAVVGGTNPSVATNVTVTVTVTNQGGALSTNVTFPVLPAAPLFGVATNAAQFGVDSSNALVVTVTNTGGQNTNDFPAFGFSVTPSLSGLAFTNTNGLVATFGGTNPAVVTNATLTVVVTNAGGATTNTNVSLAVLPALPLFSVTNNRTQFAVNSTNALVITVTNTAGQNTNAGQFPNFTFSSPSLPGGLAFLATNGLTARAGGPNPSQATNATITVVVSNAAGATTNTNVNLTILPAAPLFSVTSNRTQFGVDSSNALVVTVTNTGSGAQNTNDFPDFGFSVTPSLSGLAFTNTNGLVATYGGTNPAVVTNNATMTVTVTNAGGTNTTNVSLAVLPALPLFSVTNNRTQFGVNSSNALVVTVTNTEGQNTNAGQFPTFSYSSTNLPLGGIAFTNTNTLIGTAGSTNPTLATNATITVVVSNAAGATTNTNVNLTILPAAPLFSVTSNRTQYGVDSSNALVVTVTNTNGGAQNLDDFPDFGFSVSPSLSGLDLTNTNGLEATYGGTNPAVVTNATLTVTVTNAGGTNTTNVSLAVLPAVPELEVATNGTIQFGVSNTSAITVTVTNGDGQNTSAFPLTFSASNLPTNFGWSLTPVGGTNGVIGSANPTRATNVTNLLITVTNAGGSASTNLALRVLPLAPTNFVYTYGPSGTNRFRAGESNVTLSVTIATNGQNTNDFPITFGDDGTSLPAGLTLATNGLLSGTPSLAATYQSVFFATNEAGSGTNTNTIQVFGGAPQIVGADSVALTNLTTNTYFRYQVSARGVGQNWAGRSDFPDDASLTNNWNTNGQVVLDAALTATSGILRYTWSDTNLTYASLEWSEPLPVDSPWLASVTVLLTSNGVATSLDGLGLTGDDFVGGMLAAFGDGADPDNYVGTIFYGNSNHLSGVASANIVTNSNQVTTGILTNTSSVSMGWIGLRSTNVTGTNRLLVLGNPGTNNPTWSTNVSWPVNSWTNAAGSNSLILRLSGESMAPVNTNYAVEFEEFVIVPLGDLTYSSTNLPSGLTIDPVTGLITGTLPATNLTTTSTVTISNSLGTTNLTIEFDIQ